MKLRIAALLLCLVTVLSGCADAQSETHPPELESTAVQQTETGDTAETESPVPSVKELDIEIREHRDNELVFSITMDDFIGSYNSIYAQDKDSSYLTPSPEWRKAVLETGIHSEHETTLYTFSENEKVWSLPTISVYTPSDSNAVQEITVNFDEHSRTEELFDFYEQMCYYAVKVFFPDMEDGKIVELCTTLNELAYDNVFPNEEGYSRESVPCALYYRDGIGLYPYFAIGEWVHLCIIPVNQETIAEFEARGVEIHEIQG